MTHIREELEHQKKLVEVVQRDGGNLEYGEDEKIEQKPQEISREEAPEGRRTAKEKTKQEKSQDKANDKSKMRS